MKIRILYILLFSSPPLLLWANSVPKKTIYLDPSQPIQKRVENLMSLMTLEEKIAQMCQYVGL